jgi:cephalosporin hydroxylase
MSEMKKFEKEVEDRIKSYSDDSDFQKSSNSWLEESMRKKYVYNFSFLGRPIIQYPQDMVAMQEIIWKVQPDLIIETGIAHGGSLVLSASMLELNAACGGPSDASVLGVDIDIRSHNREAIEAHPMSKRIDMIQGSSIDSETIAKVHKHAEGKKNILVFLDSNHTHEHVLAELEAYAPLVAVGSYCVVYDTFVEDVPDDVFPDRPWSPGDNPKTAVWSYLKENPSFEIDKSIQDKLLVTVAPDGYLKRTK